jgi:hypothetical protein
MRLAVDSLPRHTREAMLDAIRDNKIIAGGYADSDSGGICPMLAAHRNGGRTNAASFARSWDRFTGARRPRLATQRELHALKSYLEVSLLREEQGEQSMVEIADGIRAERRAAAEAAAVATPQPDLQEPTERVLPEPRAPRKRPRWSDLPGNRGRDRWAGVRGLGRPEWLMPKARHDIFNEVLTAAEKQLSRQHATHAQGGEHAAERN